MTERQVLALTLWGEARGEPTVGKLAVASVLRNRKAALRWGTTYDAVCRAPKQFSCWNDGDPNRPRLDELAGLLARGVDVSDAALRECLWIADGVLGNAFPSLVGRALHYYATWLPQPPKWASAGRVVATIGDHVFLEGVR